MPARRELSGAALAALAEATVDGQMVRLHRQLDRDDYDLVNEALKRLGGKWRGGKTQAHVFPSHVDPEPLVQWVVAAGEMPPANPTQLYPTPPDIADLVVQCAKLDEIRFEEPLHGLEPSAGLAGLVKAALRSPHASYIRRLDAVEILPANAAYLRKYIAARDPRVQVHEADWLKWEPEPLRPEGVDFVLINPPFQGQGYVKHVTRAWEALARFGRIAGIAPSSFLTRDTLGQAGIDLRILIARWGGWEILEKGTFAESGTDVETVLFWAEKPAPHWISANDRPFEGFTNGWTASVALHVTAGGPEAVHLADKLRPKVADGRMTLGEAKGEFHHLIMKKPLEYDVVHESLVNWDQLLGHLVYYYEFEDAPRTRQSSRVDDHLAAPLASVAPAAPATRKAHQRPLRAAQEPAAPPPAPTPPPAPNTPVRVVQTRLI